MLYQYQDAKPQISDNAFIAPTAVVLGQVTVGAGSSIWFNCVLRGDINRITIGNNTNIQDGCLLHVTHRNPVVLEDRITAGHGAILHGCHIEADCLIAMGAIVLDGAVVGTGSIVAAGALIAPATTIPPESLVMGVPARVVRPVTRDDREKIERGWQNYVRYASSYRDMDLKPLP